MTVRDLPALLRVIDRVHEARVIVTVGDDSVSFDVAELDPDAGWSIRPVLFQIYLDRGGIALRTRLSRRKKAWNWYAKHWARSLWSGTMAAMRSVKTRLLSWRQRLSVLGSEWQSEL